MERFRILKKKRWSFSETSLNDGRTYENWSNNIKNIKNIKTYRKIFRNIERYINIYKRISGGASFWWSTVVVYEDLH